MVSKSITAMTSSPIVFLLLFNLVMLLVGMFMEANAAIILITPVLLPVSKAFGIDPLFFGIIMVLNVVFGLLTPPVGINLFVACGIKRQQNVRYFEKTYVDLSGHLSSHAGHLHVLS